LIDTKGLSTIKASKYFDFETLYKKGKRMKLLIASDIHGSAYWTKKLVDVFTNGDYDKLVILGDVLYHGPRNDLPKEYAPKKVIEMLNNLKDKIICVQGNCDAEVDQMVLDFDVSSKHTVLVTEENTFYLTHGHHPYPTNLEKGTILLTGHTHIPLYEMIGENKDILHINPGSISIPKGGFPSSYVRFDGSKFSFFDFEGTKLEIEGQER